MRNLKCSGAAAVGRKSAGAHASSVEAVGGEINIVLIIGARAEAECATPKSGGNLASARVEENGRLRRREGGNRRHGGHSR